MIALDNYQMSLLDVEWKNAYYNMKAINPRNSGFNYCEETAALGFQERWDLGGDAGHFDFINWLSGYFSYTHFDVCELVFRSFCAAKENPQRAYDPCVLFALSEFTRAGQPSHYYPDPADDELIIANDEIFQAFLEHTYEGCSDYNPEQQ